MLHGRVEVLAHPYCMGKFAEQALPAGDMNELPLKMKGWLRAIRANMLDNNDDGSQDFTRLNLGGLHGWSLFIVGLVVWRVALKEGQIRPSKLTGLLSWKHLIHETCKLFLSILHARTPTKKILKCGRCSSVAQATTSSRSKLGKRKAGEDIVVTGVAAHTLKTPKSEGGLAKLGLCRAIPDESS
jgi:hypothetical protein